MIWSQGQLIQAGKYRIIRELGRGGFGLTYLAEDCILSRQVVIKAPNRQFQADQEYEKFIRRFQREGQVLAQISHPNVVQVIDFFQEAGVPCLVMAYVDGETLNERIYNHGRLSENEAVEIFRKLATALRTVHQAGLIHCDIKPDNIMLRQRSNEPVLIDFGSAKSLQPATIRVTSTINENYAPYEQRRTSGQKRKPQPTLDIYALAATLYFAVTGQQPQASIDRKFYGDELKLPQQYQPGLSDWLNQAIWQGMAIEPENRPQLMQAWLGFLHPPQPTPPQPTPPQAKSSPSQSSSQQKPKKPQNQPHQSTDPFIPLFFLSLVYLAMGTLLGLSNAGTEAVAVAVAGALAVAGAGAGAGAVAGAGAWAVTVAGAWAVSVAVAVSGAGVVFGAETVAGAVVAAVVWAGVVVVAQAKAVESLEKRYDSRSIFIILGITSTLGLVLGCVLGWWLTSS